LNKEHNLTGALHILVFDQEKKEVTIGRGSESHVRISDISVSRTHAIIELRDNKIFVRDNKSKFGTLVRMGKPISFSKCEDRSYLQ
jgi:pSer/pThr/pTyr-binding forkhead associated (FHA) protein